MYRQCLQKFSSLSAQRQKDRRGNWGAGLRGMQKNTRGFWGWIPKVLRGRAVEPIAHNGYAEGGRAHLLRQIMRAGDDGCDGGGLAFGAFLELEGREGRTGAADGCEGGKEWPLTWLPSSAGGCFCFFVMSAHEQAVGAANWSNPRRRTLREIRVWLPEVETPRVSRTLVEGSRLVQIQAGHTVGAMEPSHIYTYVFVKDSSSGPRLVYTVSSESLVEFLSDYGWCVDHARDSLKNGSLCEPQWSHLRIECLSACNLRSRWDTKCC